MRSRPNPAPRPLALAILLVIGPAVPSPGGEPTLSVEAGRYDRIDTPISVVLPIARPPAAADPDNPTWVLREIRAGEAVPVQVERVEPAGSYRLTWVLPGRLAAGDERTYALEASDGAASPWSFLDGPEGSLELKNRERTVFRYNRRPIGHPNYPEVQRRSAYIHPAFTPTGALVTGDYSKAHPHHRGFFLAYTKTQIGDLHPDFWNIQAGSGKVYCDRLDKPSAGPVAARFTAHHRWEAAGAGVVLRERWDVTAYDVPGSPYWLFDLTATQQATGEPLRLLPYRYGGMAYRGPDSFLPHDALDVLTSAGHHRRDGDQKPARWVDLTGPVADGSPEYAGALIADHPGNVNHPTVARIHPTSLPFFCYVPGHDEEVVIGGGGPTVFRYRILIHDGRPDRDLDERVWRDFAEPPTVRLASRPGREP